MRGIISGKETKNQITNPNRLSDNKYFGLPVFVEIYRNIKLAAVVFVIFSSYMINAYAKYRCYTYFII